MNKEKFLKELKRTRSQAESLMYSLHYLLEETVYDARDYVDNELMKPIFDELDNQEQAVMNGEVSDSRRVKDDEYEPYHGKRYQIIVYSDDIGYDEKYDSDNFDELKRDAIREFIGKEDEVGIVDYNKGEWVYINSKYGNHTFNLEKAFPLSKSLANRHSRALEKLNSKNAEKDWLSDSRRVKDGKKRIKDSDYTYDTVDYKGYTIRIEYDNDYQNPFEEWDEECQIYNVGHRNFGMGKDIGYRFDTDEEAREYFGDAYYLPFAVNGYDDSCYETSVDRADGFLVWERAAFEHLGTSNTPEQDLRNSLKLLSDYASGKVFGYIIENPDGEEMDSCWGFFGEDYIDELIDEAKGIIDTDIEQKEKQKEKYERGREDREFDEFWAKRGDIGDSVRKRNVK